MLEVKTNSEPNIKQASPKMVSSSPKMGRKSSWKEVNALLKNSMAFSTINSDFTFGSSPKKERGDARHHADSDTEDASCSIKASESVGSIDWNYKSDVSVLTSRSVDTYASKVSSDNFNFDKDTSFGFGGGVAFRNAHRNDSFDDSDIQKVETVEDDEDEEGVVEGETKQLVKVIEPALVVLDDEESVVLRSRGNWIGGDTLSTNKLAMLLSDMEVQLKNTASFLIDSADDYLNRRKLEGDRLKSLLSSSGESVPENKKLLRSGAPKVVRSGSPARAVTVVGIAVPSYDDSKSVTSTVSANSTRSRPKSPPTKRVNSTESHNGSELTVENLAKRNAAAAAAASAVSSSKNGVASSSKAHPPVTTPSAKSPLDAARGKAGFASPQRGRTSSPQRTTARPSTSSSTSVVASRDSSVQRKPAGPSGAATPSKPAPLIKSNSGTSAPASAKSSVRSATPNGRSRSVEPAVSGANARRSSSVQPASRANGAATPTTAAAAAVAGSKRSATPTGRGMGTGSRKLNEPVKKEALTPLVEKAAIPKTPIKTPSKSSTTNAAGVADSKRFPSPEKKSASAAAAGAGSKATDDKTASGRTKVSLKAPIPTLSELKVATPKRKSLPGPTTPGKPNGSASLASPTKQPATRRATTGGAAGGAAAGGAKKDGTAAGPVDPVLAAAAPILEKLSIPLGGVMYLPPQPEIYLSTLIHSTPTVIASMFSKSGPSNSNTRAAAFTPPTMDALEEIIKKVMEERTNAEAAAAAAAAGVSVDGNGSADVVPEKDVMMSAATTTDVDKVMYATPLRASSATPAQRRSGSVERLSRPSTTKNDLHIWPAGSAEPSDGESSGSGGGGGNQKSPLKSTRSSAPIKPRFSVK